MATQKNVTLRRIWDVEVACLEAIDGDARIGLCPFLSTARGQLTNCVRHQCHLWLTLPTGAGECGFLSIAKGRASTPRTVHDESVSSPKQQVQSGAVASSASDARSAERLALRVTEAAHLLGISRNTVYELVRQGKLPSIKFGHRILIPRKALVDTVEQPWSSAQ